MISLAMPTYNGERFLREQLDSIYNQTIVPDEVIVVDDCSTDGTISILEEYKKKYGLKYWVNEKNLGYNKNFEKAISLCTGDYIALSDQDDVWFLRR
jgi:glycosyltransferase involved in cell wall biosynthesis